jgi:hypothetical protein
LKEKGIDKMLEDAREDHKENDAANMGRKCESSPKPRMTWLKYLTELRHCIHGFICIAASGWRLVNRILDSSLTPHLECLGCIKGVKTCELVTL